MVIDYSTVLSKLVSKPWVMWLLSHGSSIKKTFILFVKLLTVILDRDTHQLHNKVPKLTVN